ncbi:nucleotide exchange factor GrpE [Candidatus Cloacimonadota bacterium]
MVKQNNSKNDNFSQTENNVEINVKKEKKKKPNLNEQIEILKVELDAVKDQKMRIAAEFENFRRRSVTEKSQWIKNANERLLLEICDIRDNFERGLEVGKNEKNGESYKKGIELIFQQLENMLKKEGIKKIEAMNEEFDPQYHEALAHIPSELEDNKVVAVIQNGYMLNDKIIRAARVAVSNGETPPEQNKNKDKK